jgi:hypothetical protein
MGDIVHKDAAEFSGHWRRNNWPTGWFIKRRRKWKRIIIQTQNINREFIDSVSTYSTDTGPAYIFKIHYSLFWISDKLWRSFIANLIHVREANCTMSSYSKSQIIFCYPWASSIITPWRRMRQQMYSSITLSLSTWWRGVVSFKPLPHGPWENSLRYLLYRRLGGSQRWSARYGENKFPTYPMKSNLSVLVAGGGQHHHHHFLLSPV